ncbi:hypothetical protein QNO07_20615 [Streptomyces sp. 549]|uniref:hypothetical protein n=1 Tax=Streptomyces sp. 549 TaxID=3049076 RepID=UPI0024C2B1A3|nr:hypothetical protein [Streptomyces sp. 549]MDK1475791.1 hypothetical protein [Streptomyces sp. 549]
MQTLLTYAGPADERSLADRTGGLPLVPSGVDWPECATCNGPMQFVAHLLVGDELLLAVWMCQSDPGACEEWDPWAGGNRALLYGRDGLRPAEVPEGGPTLLAEVSGMDRTPVDAPTYSDASRQWADAPGRGLRDALGKVGGEPSWLQGDETPDCPGCSAPMEFAAQWEEGHDHKTAVNFGGGGCGYGFVCRACLRAVFLWQT